MQRVGSRRVPWWSRAGSTAEVLTPENLFHEEPNKLCYAYDDTEVLTPDNEHQSQSQVCGENKLKRVEYRNDNDSTLSNMKFQFDKTNENIYEKVLPNDVICDAPEIPMPPISLRSSASEMEQKRPLKSKSRSLLSTYDSIYAQSKRLRTDSQTHGNEKRLKRPRRIKTKSNNTMVSKTKPPHQQLSMKNYHAVYRYASRTAALPVLMLIGESNFASYELIYDCSSYPKSGRLSIIHNETKRILLECFNEDAIVQVLGEYSKLLLRSDPSSYGEVTSLIAQGSVMIVNLFGSTFYHGGKNDSQKYIDTVIRPSFHMLESLLMSPTRLASQSTGSDIKHGLSGRTWLSSNGIFSAADVCVAAAIRIVNNELDLLSHSSEYPLLAKHNTRVFQRPRIARALAKAED